MADVNIDSLLIDVKTNTTNAKNGLDELANTLGKIRKSVSGGLGLNAVINQLGKLDKAASSFSSDSSRNIKELFESLQTLGKLQNIKLSSSLANQITNIGASVDILSGVDFSKIGQLADGINTLSTVGNVKISSTIANQITNIGAAADLLKGVDFSNLNNLANGLNALGSIGDLKISSSIGTQLQAIGTAAKSLEGLDFSPLHDLSSALESFRDMPKISVTTFANGLKKLAEIDLGQLETQVSQLATVMKPLADEMAKIAAGFAAFPSRIQKLVTSNEKLNTSTKKVTKSFANMAVKITAAVFAVKKIGTTIAGWINESNEYIENLNLFNASMGQYAEEAQAYAEKVGDVMGIDPGEWMRNQGVFMTLAEGFGVASDRAYTMSQNLTQLGYDLSSFFNISFEESMQKLQSGLSGELEPLRRLGYDLSQAKLEAIALDLGITKTFSDMSQAEKSQLRYYAIMTQVTKAQGDMARTLDAPANQLRILKAQVTMCARALGNIFIPILNKTLPILIAFAKVIRWVADGIAKLVGFTLPEVDYSGVNTGIESVTEQADESSEALEGAKESAQEYKNALMGFDELNVLPDPTKASSSSSVADLTDLSTDGFDFELPTYDFMAGLEDRVDNIFEKMKSFLTVSINLDPIKESLNSLGDSFKHLFDVGKKYLGSLWENILKPIGSWTIEKAVPAVIELVASAFEFLATVLEKLYPLFEKIMQVLSPIVQWLGEKLVQAIQWITDSIKQLTEKVASANSFGEFLKSLDGKEIIILSIATAIGSVMVGLILFKTVFSAVTTVITGVKTAITLLTSPVGIAIVVIGALVAAGILLYKNWDTISAKAKEIWGSITDWIGAKVDAIKAFWEDTKVKFGEVVDFLEYRVEVMKGYWESVKGFFKKIIDAIKGFFESLGKKWESVTENISEKIEVVKTKFDECKTKIINFKNAVVNAFTSLWNSIKGKFDNIVGGLKDIWNWAQNVINKVGEIANGAWDTVKTKVTTVFTGQQKASGGFVNQGEMFIAREAGPELVGSIGNRTAVANNDQIVAGISSGVYNAVVSAMGNRGGNSVTLNVNGKQFARAIYGDMKSVANEHGISLVNA